MKEKPEQHDHVEIVDEPGMAERFQRGLQRAFTMKPTHPTPKLKERPARNRRAHKGNAQS
jgi:hypothetical protein